LFGSIKTRERVFWSARFSRDLVAHFRAGSLAEPDAATFYGGARGVTDGIVTAR
jgi:hypothetical protein